MASRPLGPLIRRVVGAALASSAAGVYACDDGGGGAIGDGAIDGATAPDVSTFDASVSSPSDAAAPDADAADARLWLEGLSCPDPLPDLAPGLTPAVPVDYVEIRARARSADGGAGAWSVESKAGTPCATASDAGACASALAASDDDTPTTGWATAACDDFYPAPRRMIVVTRGDEVVRVTTREELVELLAPIDTLEEARLVFGVSRDPLYCGPSSGRAQGYRRNASGSFDFLVPGDVCGRTLAHWQLSADGTVTMIAIEPAPPGYCSGCFGRRPDGLVEARAPRAAGLAGWFGEVAHLEAASVLAFRRLEEELVRFGAPPSLVARARRARRDEIRHARQMASLARRHGGSVAAVEVAPSIPRDLFAFALENAVEGCVRETYGAVASAFQAERASPELRPPLQRVAADEARHAELAHDLAAWVAPQLTERQRAALERARARTLADLRASLHAEPDPEARRVAGVPSAFEAGQLLDGLDAHILRAA